MKLWRHQGGVRLMLWPEREVPQFGTGTFTPTGEDGIVLRIKNVDRGLGEK